MEVTKKRDLTPLRQGIGLHSALFPFERNRKDVLMPWYEQSGSPVHGVLCRIKTVLDRRKLTTGVGSPEGGFGILLSTKTLYRSLNKWGEGST